MDLHLTGDTALVTASSSGLGKASATALAREGANVVINGRDKAKLAEAKADIEAIADGDVVAQTGDLTNRSDVESLVDRTVDEFGGLDHLVTSAGGPPSGAFGDTTDDDWYDAFDLLLMSVVRSVRAAEPHLQADGGGSIVNITSRSVKEALDSLVLSNSVRMGVIGLEKTLSRELAPEVRVNAVLPGSHETSRTEDLVEAAVERGEFESYEEGIQARGEGVPVGRIGEPMELGDTVAYLCSDRAGYVNGEAVVVDGGSGRSNL
jgi:3-oxoacyl-[acyl-carrier protein] reductase